MVCRSAGGDAFTRFFRVRLVPKPYMTIIVLVVRVYSMMGGFRDLLRKVHYSLYPSFCTEKPLVSFGSSMNYCPTCRREYKDTSGDTARHCPVCGSVLVQITDSALDVVRQKNIPKK